MTRELAAEIAGVGDAAAIALAGDAANETEFRRIVDEHETNVRGILADHYERVWLRWGGRLLAAAAKVAPRAVPPAGGYATKAEDAVFRRLLSEWIEAHAGRRVTAIAEATAEQIRVAVGVATSEATEAGLGAREAAKLVREHILSVTDSDVGRVRALTIARTETHAVTQAANDQAAEMLDVPGLEREWVAAAQPGRTRPSHLEANGQRRPTGAPFQVGAALLMHPGDPASDVAEEVINCRCVLVFVAP